MHVTAKLPVQFTGQPIKSKIERDVFASVSYGIDIPEVSLSDMPVAFETWAAWNSIPAKPYEYELEGHKFQARSMGGKLYRRVSSDQENIADLFPIAFPTYEGGIREVNTAISKGTRTTPATRLTRRFDVPLSLPIFRQLEWQLKCRKLAPSQKSNNWPNIKAPQGEIASDTTYGKMNYVDLQTILPMLYQYDEPALEAALAMHQIHVDKFVIADGELWMETSPPVIQVRLATAGWRTEVILSMLFAPSSQDTCLNHTYFSLDAKEEAFEFAKTLLSEAIPRERKVNSHIVDHTVRYEIADQSLLKFDYRDEYVRQISCALAMQARRFLANPRNQHNLSPDDIGGILRSYEEVLATNYITGEFGDASPWIDINFECWVKSKGAKAQYVYGDMQHLTHMVKVARNYEEDRPIRPMFSSAAVPLGPKG